MLFFKNKQFFLAGFSIALLTLFSIPAQAQAPAAVESTTDFMSPAEISELVGVDTPVEPELMPIVASADVPSDIVLLLDNSGSMKVNDPQFLTAKAVTEFINQLDDNTRLGIVIFDQKVTLAHPLTEISSESRAQMLNSLKKINYKGLRTNSPDGLERAIYELKLHARDDTERFIVFLTDGIVDTGDKQKDIAKVDWMRKELAADASNNDIRIFGIAFTDGADFQLIQSLAQQTNAEYFRAFSADKIADVFVQIQDRITRARQEALQAEIEASKPPPPPVIVEPPKPAPPPKPIIVQVPEQTQDNKMTQYMLFGIAGLLILILIIVLLRGRSSGAGGATKAAGVKLPDVQLVDMRGVTDQQSYPLTTEITQIGRIKGKETPGVTYIVIPEKSISRHHAVIEYRNHAFWVMDQGSGNGTKLNNQLLEEEHRLKHGDILTFDTFNFMFSEPEMEQSDATVVQASASQGKTDEIFDMAFDEDDTEMLPSAGEVQQPAPAPKPAASATSEPTADDTADIIDDIGSWDFDIEESPAEPQPEPQPETKEEKPKKVDPVKEGMIEKTDDGFQPARTMTPDEFDRLFSEMNDEDK